MMTLHEQLEEVFQNVFADDSLTLSDKTTAANIEGWDSVAHINLMFSLEESFDVKFAGNELTEFVDIGELKGWLAKHTAGQMSA